MARIDDLISKGPALTAADVHEIEVEVALLPIDEAHARQPWIWEAIERIVNDPDYRGDAEVPG